ncbi:MULTISPECIES: hypothetical protein [Enterobacteriaceae]|uniref:hypothetical protein n=1 Tax=Enterobacteriaceae TaxID=543 RepID=UPI002E2888F4|nr:hypothetical protein [Klebsiella pneumoniae]MED6004907.1 hypothetical protein [Klebsiella pneumoniae]MED6058279.1 hypothetical protein [Klebsiella pneumoniae]
MTMLIERVNVAQFLQNQDQSDYYKKRNLSERLSEEVEQFLSNGGKIKEIPLGHSEFKDGKIPIRLGPKKGSKDVYETPDEVIKERNAKIRSAKRGGSKPKPKKKTPKPYISAKRCERTKQQSKFLKQLVKKFRGDDRDRLCKLVGITKQTFNNTVSGDCAIGLETWEKLIIILEDFEFTNPEPKYKRKDDAETLRRNAVSDAKKQAIAEGKTEFTAKCRFHGETTYVIQGNGECRCKQCRYNNEERERQKFNRVELSKTLELGLKTFKGICKNCGDAEMRIRKNQEKTTRYSCIHCDKNSRKAYNKRVREGL